MAATAGGAWAAGLASEAVLSPSSHAETLSATVDEATPTGVFHRRLVHELSLQFPNYEARLAEKGYKFFYPQNFYIHDGRMYILYGAWSLSDVPAGSWVSIHDWSTGAYERGFHLGIATFGEGLVVKDEPSGLMLYAMHSAGKIGRWDLTTFPSDGATQAAAASYTVGLQSQFAWNEQSELWTIQLRDRGASRHRFARMKADSSFTFDADVHFDPTHFPAVSPAVLGPLNVKVQAICSFGSGYAVGYGGAHELVDPVTPDKYPGIRIFSGTGELLADGIMHPDLFADILSDAGATLTVIENEGIASYESGLYALWTTQVPWEQQPGDYGIVITEELHGDIDCRPAAAPGRLGTLARFQGAVEYSGSGVRNPMSGATITSLQDVIDFMSAACLTEWGLYTTGSSITDMNGVAIASGQFVEVRTGNFLSWDVTVRSSSRVKHYWIITDPNYTGPAQQDATRYHLNESQWVGGGSQSPQGTVVASPGCMWLRSNGELWIKTSGTGDTGWVLK
jgi:hypothetical protein